MTAGVGQCDRICDILMDKQIPLQQCNNIKQMAVITRNTTLNQQSHMLTRTNFGLSSHETVELRMILFKPQG